MKDLRPETVWSGPASAAEPRTGRAPARTLVGRLRNGDAEAMTEIFRAHLGAVYNYCYRRTGSRSAAEDLASVVFLEVWRHRRRAESVNDSPLPWLYGVATNVCRNYLRSRARGQRADRRIQFIDGGADQDHGRDPADMASGRVDASRRLHQVLARVAELARTDQEVFFLVCWEGLTYEQAAAALNIPIGTVRSRLARVRRELRLTDSVEADA